MISFSMYNQQDNNSPLLINKELLQLYRERCDTYLVNIKRQLSRNLVDYKLFQELQQVNNSFFVIIDYLDSEHYTTVKEVEDDRQLLVNNINIFTKHCKNCVPLDIFESIMDDCNILALTIHKLIQIVKTVNDKGDIF